MNYTIDPVEWVILDSHGMSRGYVTNPFSEHFRAYPSYGKAEDFDTLEKAAEYVAKYHNV